MELKTQAMDRVLEVLSPALAAELDRVVSETRQALEQEFEKRLQSAARDAEAAARSDVEAQTARAVADAREAMRREVTEEIEKQFFIKLAEATSQLKNEAVTERARLQEQLDRWRIFAETPHELAEASSQTDILSRFLKLVQPFAAGFGLYVAKADGLAMWKSHGDGAFPEIISQQTTDPESYFRAITVRGRTVAAVCAVPPFKSDALDFLCSSLERAIEAFGLRLRTPVPKPAVVASKTTGSRQS